MRKKILLLVILIGISLIGFQTLAYTTAQTRTKNLISTSFIDLVLSVKTVDKNGRWIDLNTQTIKVMPGDEYSQIPYVTNTGEVPMYTRIFLESKIMDENDKPIDHSGLIFDIDETKWELDDEGWYRYKEIVEVGKDTLPLFTVVKIPTDLGNDLSNYTTSIRIYAQAVQSEHNDYTKSVMEVEGWPMTIENENSKGGVE